MQCRSCLMQWQSCLIQCRSGSRTMSPIRTFYTSRHHMLLCILENIKTMLAYVEFTCMIMVHCLTMFKIFLTESAATVCSNLQAWNIMVSWTFTQIGCSCRFHDNNMCLSLCELIVWSSFHTGCSKGMIGFSPCVKTSTYEHPIHCFYVLQQAQ